MQQPTVLFSIYQNNTCTIRGLVDETIDPLTQHIILNMVGFLVTTGENVWQQPEILYLLKNLYYIGEGTNEMFYEPP